MSGEGLIPEQRPMGEHSGHSGAGHARLKELMHRGVEFLGCDWAIMGGAMSWVSERHLVSALSNAGAFGVIACGAMSPELLDTEIAETRARTQKPFGVNLITMHPQLSELVDTCVKHEVGHVVLAGGLPPGWAIEKVKQSGAKLMAFAPALSLARKLMRSGADALVIEGMEAGGHIGPVSTSVLAQEILPHVCHDIPIFIAGGIGRGEAIAAYLEMGAVGVQLGTRFVCAHESIAHANFKKAFIRASARDAVLSVQIDGPELFDAAHHCEFYCDVPSAGRYRVSLETVDGPTQGAVQLFQNSRPVSKCHSQVPSSAASVATRSL